MDRPLGIKLLTGTLILGGTFGIQYFFTVYNSLKNTKTLIQEYFSWLPIEQPDYSIPYVALIIAVLLFVCALGVWNLHKWAKIMTTIMAAVMILSVMIFSFIGPLIGAICLYFLYFDQKTKDAL